MRITHAILLVLLTACSTQSSKAPYGVLDRDRFEQVLLEAQLIEARMNHELIITQQSDIPAERYYSEMFAAEGTTKEQFQKSFSYYSGRPDEMKLIYEEIFTELNRRKDEQPQ